MERLRITWLNVIRVRALALATAGQDLPMWNFDQSPFHMNEAGSKSARSLRARGQHHVVIKEGHSATREHWSANTMTASATSQFENNIPPLEIMFRVESSGVHVHPRLRGCIPNWAPWLSVGISKSGSYNEEHILRYLDWALPRITPDTPWNSAGRCIQSTDDGCGPCFRLEPTVCTVHPRRWSNRSVPAQRH